MPVSTKVTVAIPTYKRVEYLKECIQSVLNQTFQDFTIVVFDNASEQPVEQALQAFQDRRIQFIGNTENIGEEGNLNRILGYPFESEYLVIFHDDDAMHPNMLEAQTSFLDAHKNVVFVGSDFKPVSRGGMDAFSNIAQDKIRFFTYNDNLDFIRAEMRWLRFAFSSAMYRVKAIGSVRMSPKRFSDFADIALLAEVSKSGPTAFLSAPLMNYRIHAGQYSELKKEGYLQGALELLSFFRERFPAEFSRYDDKLFRSYSINFLLRSYAHIGKGFVELLGFLKECRRQKIIRYADYMLIDARGIVSLLSIMFQNRKIINLAIWTKKMFRL